MDKFDSIIHSNRPNKYIQSWTSSVYAGSLHEDSTINSSSFLHEATYDSTGAARGHEQRAKEEHLGLVLASRTDWWILYVIHAQLTRSSFSCQPDTWHRCRGYRLASCKFSVPCLLSPFHECESECETCRVMYSIVFQVNQPAISQLDPAVC